jgi:hypothetical protein
MELHIRPHQRRKGIRSFTLITVIILCCPCASTCARQYGPGSHFRLAGGVDIAAKRSYWGNLRPARVPWLSPVVL